MHDLAIYIFVLMWNQRLLLDNLLGLGLAMVGNKRFLEMRSLKEALSEVKNWSGQEF